MVSKTNGDLKMEQLEKLSKFWYSINKFRFHKIARILQFMVIVNKR